MSRSAIRKASKQKRPAPVRLTPLNQKLRAPTKATPQDLFTLAMEKWAAGERFDIGRMAEELKVSRATVFRWVGSRELLYAEVISTLFEGALQQALAEAKGTGADKVADVARRLMTMLMEHAPLQTFVKQDPEYAMRIIMSKSSTVEQRSAASIRKALEDHVERKEINPVMNLDDLAYVVVRIGESFLYRESITGEQPNIESAITAVRILVAAES
jgi:AcrR family transcriptional regulator